MPNLLDIGIGWQGLVLWLIPVILVRANGLKKRLRSASPRLWSFSNLVLPWLKSHFSNDIEKRENDIEKREQHGQVWPVPHVGTPSTELEPIFMASRLGPIT